MSLLTDDHTGDAIDTIAAGWASIETAKHYAALSDDSLHRIAAAASK